VAPFLWTTVYIAYIPADADNNESSPKVIWEERVATPQGRE